MYNCVVVRGIPVSRSYAEPSKQRQETHIAQVHRCAPDMEVVEGFRRRPIIRRQESFYVDVTNNSM